MDPGITSSADHPRNRWRPKNAARSYCRTVEKELNKGICHTDIWGLENLQFLLGLIEIFGCSRHRLYTISMKEILRTLKNVSKYLNHWKPLRLPKTPESMKMLSLLNLPNCYEKLSHSITDLINRIRFVIGQRKVIREKSSFFVSVESIVDDMRKAQEIIKSKFASYPSFDESMFNKFHFNTLTLESGAKILPLRILDSLKFFAKHGKFQFGIVSGVNLLSGLKLKKLTLSDLIQTSTDVICQICHDGLDKGQNLGTFVICNHVCCSSCIQTWLRKLQADGEKWYCASCRQPFREWGEISSDRGPKVHVLNDVMNVWSIHL